MKRLLSIFILLALLILPACSNQTDDGTDDTAAGNATESTAEETTELLRENTPDNLPELDYNGATINVYHFGNDNSTNYDAVGEAGGDIVYDAVYLRNLNVEDRLNIKINWIKGSDNWDTHPANVKTSILSGSSDYDVIYEENSRCFQHSLYGYMKDLIDAPYIDTEQPWWYGKLMEQGAINSTHLYYVSGDFALTTLFGMSATYFNKEIFTDHFGDYNVLYNAVREGKWTHEMAMKYCREVYTDINGDNIADDSDLYGFRYEQWGVPNHLSMSIGVDFITRDDNGYPVPDLYNDTTVLWGETLYKMLYTDNMSYSGATDKYTSFINGTSLFVFSQLGDATKFRDTSFEYGLLPHPKINESVDYMSAAATANGEGAAIPVTAAEDKFEMSCAMLEALCVESYRKVVPVWYDTAMKVKYIETEADAEMIDIIYSHVGSPFIMIADKEIGVGSIFTNAVFGSNNDGAFASYYAKQEKPITKIWEKMIENYEKVAAQ